jgi:hypothetical protein
MIVQDIVDESGVHIIGFGEEIVEKKMSTDDNHHVLPNFV